MKENFGRRVPFFKRTVSAIEIGNDWLKIIKAEHSFRKERINDICLEKLSDVREPLTEKISSVFKELKVNRHQVVICVPRHLATVRMLNLPSINQDEIREMIELQVGKQTPYSKEEILYSHKIISSTPDGYSRVLLSIVRGELIEKYMNMLKEAGIRSCANVGLSTEGILNWAHAEHPGIFEGGNASFVLADVDSKYTDCIVFNKGLPLLTRHILVGSSHIALNSDKWKEEFVSGIKHSVAIAGSEIKNSGISAVYISGSTENLRGISDFLGNSIGVPCKFLEAFNRLQVKKSVQAELKECKSLPASVNALLGAVVGRASDINLVPRESRINRVMEEKKKKLTTAAVLVSGIIVVLMSAFSLRFYNKTSYLEELRSEISKIEKESKALEIMRMKINLMESRLDARGSSLDILSVLYRITPEELFYTAVDIKEKGLVTLRGRALEMSDVFAFVNAMEKSDYFENVKVTYTARSGREGDAHAEFQIICNF